MWSSTRRQRPTQYNAIIAITIELYTVPWVIHFLEGIFEFAVTQHTSMFRYVGRHRRLQKFTDADQTNTSTAEQISTQTETVTVDSQQIN